MAESFRSKSEALDYLELGTESGQFKKCGKLKVIDSLDMIYGRKFHPYCKANSLGEAETSYQRTQSYCPTDCRFFVEKEIAEKQESRTRAKKAVFQGAGTIGRAVLKVAATPFVYFRSLPPLVQSLIIILLIIWRLPKLKDTIVEVLKAIGGK